MNFSKKNKANISYPENPQFLNAFPHLKRRFLQQSFQRTKQGQDDRDIYGTLEDSKIDSERSKQQSFDQQAAFTADIKLKASRTQRRKNLGKQKGMTESQAIADNFFQSLQYKRQTNYQKSSLQMLQQNNFVDAHRTFEGPLSSMSPEAIDKIHAEAELKMRQLQQTGLTRQELLYDKPSKAGASLPLIEDPVFQFLKTNRLAREMLFKSGESFTVSKIIRKALRQDILPDDSMEKLKFKEGFAPLHDNQLHNDYRNFYRNRKMHPTPQEYGQTNWAKSKLEQIRQNRERAPMFLHKPLTRDQIRKKYRRQISRQDFQWQDVDLVSKFLTKAAMVQNRYKTRLPTKVQYKVQKLARRLKDMDLLPHSGRLKPTDKVPLKSLFEDIEQQLEQRVDPITGRLVPQQKQSTFQRESGRRKLDDMDSFSGQRDTRRYKFQNFNRDQQNLDQDKINRQDLTHKTAQQHKYAPIKIDGHYFIPNQKQMQWFKAKHYAKHGITGGFKPGEEQDAYKRIVNLLGKLEASQFADSYLNESVMQFEDLENTKSKIEFTTDKSIDGNVNKNEILRNIQNILKDYDTGSEIISDINYKERYQNQVKEVTVDQVVKEKYIQQEG